MFDTTYRFAACETDIDLNIVRPDLEGPILGDLLAVFSITTTILDRGSKSYSL